MVTEAEKRRCLQFSGEEDDFAYWSEKLEGYMHTKKLRGQLLRTDASNDDEKYKIWVELVQCLDKRSIMMLKSECKGNEPAAWRRLTAHLSSSETPRVMNLLEQLTSLSLEPTERNYKLFKHSRKLCEQFLSFCHKNFIVALKNGFYVSKGTLWSKKKIFEKCLIFETYSYIEQNENRLFVQKVSARLSKLHLMFLLNILEKKQLWKTR